MVSERKRQYELIQKWIKSSGHDPADYKVLYPKMVKDPMDELYNFINNSRIFDRDLYELGIISESDVKRRFRLNHELRDKYFLKGE